MRRKPSASRRPSRLRFLLDAQQRSSGGDREAADSAFRAMAGRADTKALGLHGLFVEAHRRGDRASAHAFAEEAARENPSLGWAGKAVLEFRCLTGDWAGALALLEGNKRALDKDSYRRQRAVMLTARAHRQRRDRSRQRQGVGARSGEARADLRAGGRACRPHAGRGRRIAQSLAHPPQGVGGASASRSCASVLRSALRRRRARSPQAHRGAGEKGARSYRGRSGAGARRASMRGNSPKRATRSRPFSLRRPSAWRC